MAKLDPGDIVLEVDLEDGETQELEPPVGILSEKEAKKLAIYLDEEFQMAESERSEKKEQWKKWRRQREFRPETKVLDYPWPKCFHPDVQILTESGWKLVSQVLKGEKVLSREPLTGKLAYFPVQEVHRYKVKGKLAHLQNIFMDILVTPNHRFHLESREKTGTKVVSASQIVSGFYGEGNNMLPLSGSWDAEAAVSLWGYDPGDFLELLGWFLSEGWVFKNRCLGIAQSAEANPQKCARIASLLQRMGIDHSYHGHCFLLNVDQALASHLRDVGDRYSKYIPRMYLDLPPFQLIRLFEALIAGDGNICWAKDKHRNFPRTTYGTASEALAECLQELCLKLGWSASVTQVIPRPGGKIRGKRITSSRTFYSVSVRYTQQTRFRHDRGSFTYVPYEGDVFCVTVEPWHTVYVKQNGKPIWSGNSANVSVPMAGMLTQNMWAYIKSTFQVRDPLISVKSITKTPGDVEVAETLEKYLHLLAESPFDLNLRPKISTMTLEFTSMGASFVKVPWTTDKWVFRRGDETVESTLHDGPEWLVIGREDLLYREYVQDVYRAPWIAHHFELSEHELFNRGAAGIYQNVDATLKDWRSHALDHQIDEKERMGVVQQDAKIYDLYEVYVYWKLPGERYMVDLLVTYHPDSKKVLRAEYNEIGLRPIGVSTYIERPFYVDGIGVGWICEHMQDEVDYHHRLRINNSHFASMMMWAVRRGAGFAGKESVYPGKIWKVDDPSKDIVPLQGGQIYPISLQAEAMSLQYAERAVGFSDAQRGFADMVAKSGTSAQLQMFNAQQGGKLINSVIEGAVGSMSQLALFTVIQLVKNKDRVLANERNNKRLTPEELRELEVALSVPLEDIPRKLRFDVRTTDIDKTFEVRRQNTLTLVQIYAMFWEKMLPLMQMMYSNQVPPQMQPMLQKVFTGSCNLMEKVFKFFGEDAVEKYVPDYKRMEVMLEIRAALTNDLDQAKMLLEDLRSGRGTFGGAESGRAEAAAIGGAAGAFAAAEGSAGPPGAPGFPGMGNLQQGVPSPAGRPGPLT